MTITNAHQARFGNRPRAAAAIARTRHDEGEASSLLPLIPIALLTLFMLGVVIKPI